MAIEANAGVIIERADAVAKLAGDLHGHLSRFLSVRDYLTSVGQNMTGQQKSAAVAVAQQAITDINTATTDLLAAWNASSPV